MSDLEGDRSNLPLHVAIIPDGNGRWARKRGLSRLQGHIEGTARIKEIVTAARDLGIRVLTIWGFSNENWSRPEEEVDALMELLREYILSERDHLIKNQIQLRMMGEMDRLPPIVLQEIQKTMELSAHLNGMVLNMAISYGGRQELVRAIRKISGLCREGQLDPEAIDEELVSSHLDTRGLPDPDLIIRTSGEMRVSNFLLWQMSYSEFYFTDKYWPEFDRAELLKAVSVFQERQRRYGGIDNRA